MTRTLSGLCVAAAFGFVAVVGAQDRAATEQRSGASTSANDKEITLTGCLMRGTDGKYALRNAMMANAATTTTAGASSTTASQGSANATGTSGTASNWILENKDQELSSHVGEKVEVKGKMMAAASTAAGAAGTSTTTASGAAGAATTTGSAARSAESAGERLDVESVKTVSSSCS